MPSLALSSQCLHAMTVRLMQKIPAAKPEMETINNKITLCSQELVTLRGHDLF